MIVFLHPAGLDHRAAEFLDVAFDAAPTLPLHGDRDGARTVTFADVVDEVVGWMTGPLDLVGASFGAMIAMQVAVRYPEHVRSLVLANTAARVDRAIHEQRAAETLAKGSAGMLTETLQRWFAEDTLAIEDHPGVQHATERLLADDPLGLAATWRLIADHDVLAELPRVSVPVTLIVGRRDVATPPTTMAEIARAVPHAGWVELDAAHMAFLERPEEFSAIVRDHLASVAAQEGTV